MDNSLLIFYATIVSVYGCLLYKIPNKQYTNMIVLTLITMVLIYIGQQYLITSGKVRHSPNKKSEDQYHIANIKLDIPIDDSNGEVEHFQEQQSDLGFSDSYSYLKNNISKELSNVPKNIKDIVGGELIGPYDGKCLAANSSSDEKYKWMKEPTNTPLLDSTGFVMQGGQGPLKDRVSDDKYLTGPHLDGTSDTSQSLFMFAKNKCSPGCCPSSFSCDSGCVCTTEKQREFISRGGVMPGNSVEGNNL